MAPVRVLHVVGQMNRGGVETWLLQVLRRADRARVQMDFLTTLDGRGQYDAEVVAAGGRVLPCPCPREPVGFARWMLRILKDAGPYDVVHSHVHHFSGAVLGVARCGRVATRVAHSHSNTSALDAAARPVRRLYLRAMEAAVRANATAGLAASADAAASLFGPRWREDRRWRVCHCGIDLSPFRAPLDREAVRAELGLAPSALVVGHVGRLDVPKNHAFLLRVAAEVVRRDPRASFVLVGEGPLRAAIERQAAELGLRDRVVLTGTRPDVPRLLRAFDAFLLPSSREGLPLVALEAQAAALPIVLTDSITRELVVYDELFSWRSLSDPPSSWAAALLAAVARRPPPASEALALLERSDFALDRSVRTLEEVYGA